MPHLIELSPVVTPATPTRYAVNLGDDLALVEARALVEYLLRRWTPDEWSSPGLFDDLVDDADRKRRRGKL